jgi:hypothetical protein
MDDGADKRTWSLEQLIEHACSLAMGFGAGRDDLTDEYKATREQALDIARRVPVCGSCGGLILADQETGTTCACAPKSKTEQRRDLISQMIRGEDAMAPFFTNIDCNSYADFERYLAGQMKQAYDLRLDLEARGDPDKMLDWTMAKCAVFHEVLLTFRRVTHLESQRP